MVELKLGSILHGILRDRGFLKRVAVYRAYAVWEEIVGAEVARHVRPLRLERGVLTLVADSGVWAQETSFARPAILDALRRAGVPVRDLHFRQGTLPLPEELPDLPVHAQRPAPPPGEALDLIRDPEIRQRFGMLLQHACKEEVSHAAPHRR